MPPSSFATYKLAGSAPPDDGRAYCVAVVRFYTSSGSLYPKDYMYWAPYGWSLQPGDHIEVCAPDGSKRVYVRAINQMHTGRKLKTAVRVLSRASDAQAHSRLKRNPLEWGKYLHHEVAEKCFSEPDVVDFKTKAFDGTLVFDLVSPELLTPTPEQNMNIKIESRTFVNGRDIKDYSDNQLFDLISEAEAEARRLEAIETKPAKLTARIEELKTGAKALADAVDARS